MSETQVKFIGKKCLSTFDRHRDNPQTTKGEKTVKNLRDAKALHLNNMIGDYSVVVEVYPCSQDSTRFSGYVNVSLEVALRYAESWSHYEFAKIKSITIKEVTE